MPKYRDQNEVSYEWIVAGNEQGDKHIAMIATSGGVEWNEVNKGKFMNRVKELNELGFVVHVPKYEDGSWIFEPGDKVKAAVGAGTVSRAVSPFSGAAQIIECAENGWDVFPYMGGMGFADKIGAVIKYFKQSDVEKPQQPIRFFNFSDCTYAAFLQSHHPDIFRFYCSTTSGDLWFDTVAKDAPARDQYDKMRARNLDALKLLLTTDQITEYPRSVLLAPAQEIDLENVQYFVLHNDMIWHDSADFDPEKVCGADKSETGFLRVGNRLEKGLEFNKLDTSRPYILSFEGFLQQAASSNIYATNFPKHLDEFLRQRQAKNQLPKAIEIGLFETRIDGENGYAFGASRLHDEATGLIEINDFNVERLFKFLAQIASQITLIAAAKDKEEHSVTAIPQDIKKKVLSGAELDREDIKKILEGENSKILAIREEIIDICKKYEVPVIMNNRSGHCLNIGVVGGGLVKFRMTENEVEIQQLPTKTLPLPRLVVEGAEASAAKQQDIVNTASQ